MMSTALILVSFYAVVVTIMAYMLYHILRAQDEATKVVYDDFISDNKSLLKELKRLKQRLPDWGPGGSIPTVTQLVDLAARTYGEPISAKSVEMFFEKGKRVLGGEVEIAREQFDRIPICFSFTEEVQQRVPLDELNAQMQKEFGPESSARYISRNVVQFTVRDNPLVYVGPVALELDRQTYLDYRSKIQNICLEALPRN